MFCRFIVASNANTNTNTNFSIVAEQYSQCGSSTTQPQTPEGGHINARNMLSI